MISSFRRMAKTSMPIIRTNPAGICRATISAVTASSIWCAANIGSQSFDVNQKGDIALTMCDIRHGVDVYLMKYSGNAKKQKVVRMSDLHADFLAERQLAERVSRYFTVKDGFKVQALITKPIGFKKGKKYPAVVRIHGGPVEQWAYGYDFFTQLLAANGYVVIQPNPAGSSGRSQRFIKRVAKDWANHKNNDVVEILKQLIDEGFIDEDKLAVCGYSYGGYLTNCLVTLEPDLFKAAVSGAGHSSISACYGHDIYTKWYNWELGYPWMAKSRRNYQRVSPLENVEKVKTPLLLICGAKDWNVPILNSEIFYQALKVRGVKSQLIVYPNTSHVARLVCRQIQH